ncbi:MAG: hypothetical protein ABJA93_07140, partial [Sporichthyaceae bacterium]
IRAHYGATGGALRFGFPTTDELVSATVGRESRFEMATYYWSRASGAHLVTGSIRAKYVAVGATRGRLGFPLTDQLAVTRGAVSRFQGGDIYSSAATGAHVVPRGGIRNRWLALGAQRGRLGFPRTDRLVTGSGFLVRFEGGTIQWLRATGATTVIYR